MASSSSRIPALARTTLVVVAVGLALAACGRRGALEAPPDPNAPKEEQTDGSSLASSPIPGSAKKKPRATPIPNRPFILDPLL